MKKQTKPETKRVYAEIHVPEKGTRPSKYRSAMVDYSDEDARYRPAEVVPVSVVDVPENLSAEQVQACLQTMINGGRGYSVPVKWPEVARDLERAGLQLPGGR